MFQATKIRKSEDRERERKAMIESESERLDENLRDSGREKNGEYRCYLIKYPNAALDLETVSANLCTKGKHLL